MHDYKIGLLIFSNSKTEGSRVYQPLEKLIKKEGIGVIKAVEIFERNPSILETVIENYKNTNLGMLLLVAPEADQFFPYSELEEVGQRNEKYLVTLNLDGDLEKNFLKLIEKIKASPGKRRRGCDASCR